MEGPSHLDDIAAADVLGAGTVRPLAAGRVVFSQMAGSPLHTVSRTLAAWDERGVTASARRRIVVRRLDVLTNLAEAG
ncbi:hypothetical protein [Caulobacter segnis]|uniref:hypothetical protein n=1 Tax=Caulobacter segnis TaxID=88688 RepID=UPI0026D28A3B|nr:hypothetical protein [Caulobacter segnis]